MAQNPFNKSFKEITVIDRFNIQPNTDIVISRAIRFNDEKVAYINRQSVLGSSKGYKGKGVRIPKHQIQPIVNILLELEAQNKKGFEKN